MFVSVCISGCALLAHGLFLYSVLFPVPWGNLGQGEIKLKIDPLSFRSWCQPSVCFAGEYLWYRKSETSYKYRVFFMCIVIVDSNVRAWLLNGLGGFLKTILLLVCLQQNFHCSETSRCQTKTKIDLWNQKQFLSIGKKKVCIFYFVFISNMCMCGCTL